MSFLYTKLHLNPVLHGTSALQVGKHAVRGEWPRPLVSEIHAAIISVQSVVLCASHGREHMPVEIVSPWKDLRQV